MFVSKLDFDDGTQQKMKREGKRLSNTNEYRSDLVILERDPCREFNQDSRHKSTRRC